MKNKLLINGVALLLLAVMGISCTDDFEAPATPTGSTIIDVAKATGNLDIFAAAAAKTNLANSLSNLNSGSYTVFAPHDSAFLAFFKTQAITNVATWGEAEALAYIRNEMNTSSAVSISTLAGRLNYHIVSSAIPSSAITTGNAFTTINGARLSASHTGAYYYLNANTAGNGSKILTRDLSAANGTIHVVNRVLTAVGTASVVSALGLGVSYATNPATVTGGSETGGDATGTDYDILAYALRITGLAPTLLPNQAPLPDYTLFAPTDNAFRTYLGDVTAASAIQENAAIQLLKAMDITTLTNLLKYHIVTGRILSTDLSNAQVVSTLNTGKSFTVNKSGTVTITDLNGTSVDATVSSANLLTNAGVYHQISVVLQPE
jgi:transforming growth factor-beta-induced protein